MSSDNHKDKRIEGIYDLENDSYTYNYLTDTKGNMFDGKHYLTGDREDVVDTKDDGSIRLKNRRFRHNFFRTDNVFDIDGEQKSALDQDDLKKLIKDVNPEIEYSYAIQHKKWCVDNCKVLVNFEYCADITFNTDQGYCGMIKGGFCGHDGYDDEENRDEPRFARAVGGLQINLYADGKVGSKQEYAHPHYNSIDNIDVGIGNLKDKKVRGLWSFQNFIKDGQEALSAQLWVSLNPDVEKVKKVLDTIIDNDGHHIITINYQTGKEKEEEIEHKTSNDFESYPNGYKIPVWGGYLRRKSNNSDYWIHNESVATIKENQPIK